MREIFSRIYFLPETSETASGLFPTYCVKNKILTLDLTLIDLLRFFFQCFNSWAVLQHREIHSLSIYVHAKKQTKISDVCWFPRGSGFTSVPLSTKPLWLTCPPVLGLRLALHLVVDGHHGDSVLGVRLQVLQDGGGDRSGHLVLLAHRHQTTSAWLRSQPLANAGKSNIHEKCFWRAQRGCQTEGFQSSARSKPTSLRYSVSQKCVARWQEPQKPRRQEKRGFWPQSCRFESLSGGAGGQIFTSASTQTCCTDLVMLCLVKY